MGIEHFTFNFTLDMARDLLKNNPNPDAWYNVMLEILPLWQINTVDRVAGFISQCGHESVDFNFLSENLNYSESGLLKIFGRYFQDGSASQYAHNPVMIANRVYANRLGNGDESSGDGWMFRGGGILQLTGRTNYTNFGSQVNMSAEEATAYVRTDKGAIDSACWFWDENNLNTFCDSQDIVTLTRRINGGTIGLDDRKARWEHAMNVLGGTIQPTSNLNFEITSSTVLRKGDNNPLVAQMQTKLGISADGVFGQYTELALKHWQYEHGLVADGIAGPATLSVLMG